MRRWKIVFLTWLVIAFFYVGYAKFQFDGLHRGEFHGHQFGLFSRAYRSYLQQHKGALPPIQNTTAFLSAVGQEPIFADSPPDEVAAQFVDAARGKPYHLNAWLNGKNVKDIPNPAGVVAVYEDAFPWKDAYFSLDYRLLRGVMYADGHVRVIREQQWSQIKAESHIP